MVKFRVFIGGCRGDFRGNVKCDLLSAIRYFISPVPVIEYQEIIRISMLGFLIFRLSFVVHPRTLF